MRKLMIIWIFLGAVLTLKSQVSSTEYFFNTDPGYGNGINAGSTTLIEEASNKVYEQLTFNAPITSLSNGFHTLYIRAKSVHGWSQTQARSFVKMAIPGDISLEVEYVEYFLDIDPGYGEGTRISTGGENDAWAFTVDLTDIADGFHTLFVRAMNKENHWSQVMRRPFVKTALPPELASEMTAVEYYLDTDPGAGNGTPVAFSDGAEQLDFTVDLSDVAEGNHVLKLRGKNRTGQWINMEEHHFVVIDDVSVSDYVHQEIIVSPNPVQSTLHIQSSSAVEQITIYNISGKVLQQLSNTNQSIDVSSLASGIYFIKIKTLSGERVQKIIKQ